MSGAIATTIVTSDPVVRAGLLAQLRPRPEIVIVDGDAWHGDQVVHPHVALVAGENVDENLIKLVRSNARNGHRRVIILASHLDTNAVFTALEAGASAFLRREQATADELVRVIVAAAHGEGSIPPEMLGEVLQNLGRLQRQVLVPRGLSLAPLTDREVAVLRLLSEGFAVAEISHELSYSERTIKSIIHDVTLRLGLRNRTHAVAYALREGLI
jgi:DNA-binding NarL/FixJ family response regulator